MKDRAFDYCAGGSNLHPPGFGALVFVAGIANPMFILIDIKPKNYMFCWDQTTKTITHQPWGC